MAVVRILGCACVKPNKGLAEVRAAAQLGDILLRKNLRYHPSFWIWEGRELKRYRDRGEFAGLDQAL